MLMTDPRGVTPHVRPWTVCSSSNQVFRRGGLSRTLRQNQAGAIMQNKDLSKIHGNLNCFYFAGFQEAWLLEDRHEDDLL